MSRPNAQKRKRKASLKKSPETSSSEPCSPTNDKPSGSGQFVSTNEAPSKSTEFSPSFLHRVPAKKLDSNNDAQERLSQLTDAQLNKTCKELSVLFQQLLDVSTRKKILDNPVLFEPTLRILTLLPSVITANLQNLESLAPEDPLDPRAKSPMVWKKIQRIVDFEACKSQELGASPEVARKPSPESNASSPAVFWGNLFRPPPEDVTVTKGFRTSNRESPCSAMDGDSGYNTNMAFQRPLLNVFSANSYTILQQNKEAESRRAADKVKRKSFSEALTTPPPDSPPNCQWESPGWYRVRSKTRRRSSFHQEAPKRLTSGWFSSGTGAPLDEVGFSLALRSAESLRSIQEQIALKAFPTLVQQGVWAGIQPEDVSNFPDEDQISLAWSALKSDEKRFRLLESVGDWNYYGNWSPEETADVLRHLACVGHEFTAFTAFFDAMKQLGLEHRHWFAMAAFRRWRNGLAHPKSSEPALQREVLDGFVALSREKRHLDLRQDVVDCIAEISRPGVVERVFAGQG